VSRFGVRCHPGDERIMVDDDGTNEVLLDAIPGRMSRERVRQANSDDDKRWTKPFKKQIYVKLSIGCRLIFSFSSCHHVTFLDAFAFAIGLYTRPTCKGDRFIWSLESCLKENIEDILNNETSWQAEHPRNDVG